GNTRAPFCSEAWVNKNLERRPREIIWVAHASRVLVSASRRNGPFLRFTFFKRSDSQIKFAIVKDALASTRDACAARSQSVSQTNAHISESNSSRARTMSTLADPGSRKTAKIVEPEPDVRAAPTSGCFPSHVFICARKTNFSKTGRSKSFTKVMSPNFCD